MNGDDLSCLGLTALPTKQVLAWEEEVVHVPKVMQHERQHHFHVEAREQDGL